MTDSCLASNFSRYAKISETDRRFLARFEEDAIPFPADAEVIAQGARCEALYVLSSGWCVVKYDEPDGSRQILDICHSGEFVGMRDVCFHRAICSVQTITESVLCKFPRSHLTEMFEQHPRLSATLFLIGMRNEAILIERVVNLGRRSSFARLCHLISELKHRMDDVTCADSSQVEVPIPAKLLSDILGLSEVHVYRMLKRLRSDGMATFDNGRLTVHSYERIKQAAAFDEGYLQLDKSWIPKDK